MLKGIKDLLKHNALRIAFAISIAVIYLSLSSVNNGITVPKIPHLDKVAHILMYFGLTSSWLFALHQRMTLYFYEKFMIFLGIVLFGIFLEVMQHVLTQDRSGDLFDGIANAFGTTVAILLFNFWIVKFESS